MCDKTALHPFQFPDVILKASPEKLSVIHCAGSVMPPQRPMLE